MNHRTARRLPRTLSLWFLSCLVSSAVIPRGFAQADTNTTTTAAAEKSTLDRLQKGINDAFDVVTTPMEQSLTRPLFSTRTIKIYEGATVDWQRSWDALCEAGLVNWPVKPDYLTREVPTGKERDGKPVTRTEIVRDEAGLPVFDPKSSGAITVRTADVDQARVILGRLNLPSVVFRTESPADFKTVTDALKAEGLGVLVFPPGVAVDGTKVGGSALVPFKEVEQALKTITPLAEKNDNIKAQLGEEGKVGFWLIVVVLVAGGLFFTAWYGFIHVRLFKHSVDCIRGKYDNPEDEGEISHFKALTSALSATVGLGNIAGVAVAIVVAGPGAVFWMWVVAFFGMTLKFNSCFLSQLYRRMNTDGTVLGGPMVYLDDGIREHYPALKWLGKAFAILFAFMCIMGAFGGGNLFQANQTGAMIARTLQSDSAALKFICGLVMAGLVGVVIIGGIRRIGEVTSRLVPLMCGGYVLIALIIILTNLGKVPAMFGLIFSDAFSPRAIITGGLIGVLFNAMKRAAFSNEAGLGSAAIAHAAAKTREPVREGVVAMVGPFIDTIVVCTMTALAILITDAHLKGGDGVEVTAMAFGSLLGENLGNIILTVMVCVFAYSTMISWSYYGERCIEYLFGRAGIMPYRIVYVLIIVLGPVLSLGRVIDFADMMLLSMAFPNILGSVLLAPKIKHMVKDYVARLKSGEMKPYAEAMTES